MPPEAHAYLDATHSPDIERGMGRRATPSSLPTARAAVHAASKWLAQNGWKVITSEIGYIPKTCPELNELQRAETAEFLQSLDDHDDVHRVWAALK